ncbi:hypothetical protein BHE74_00055803 [Ensete ventricosum]|nr:hypothetical protein BHE74_00055803 [Ensete ventricosum]
MFGRRGGWVGGFGGGENFATKSRRELGKGGKGRTAPLSSPSITTGIPSPSWKQQQQQPSATKRDEVVKKRRFA